MPEWCARDLDRIFGLLEEPLAGLMAPVGADALAAQARTLFSAVHGVVLLGLEQKLAETPPGALEAQLAGFVATVAHGLARAAP